MARRTLTINDRINTILDRDRREPYPDVLLRYDITVNQFARAVKKLEDCIQLSRGESRKTLEAIERNPIRRRELFNMGEEFIRQQYDRMQGRILGETQLHFYEGTFFHPENINALVYYALTFHNPVLKSINRKKVIQGIKNLPSNLQNYFRSIGLNGLMANILKKEKYLLLAVLEIFDRVYQRKTRDKSLFDLTQGEHLHKWDIFRAPKSYWQDPVNVEEAAYHVLTENNPVLKFSNREKVIQGIKSLPYNLAKYFYSIGLGGLMESVSRKQNYRNSPLVVLEVFDRVYQRKTRDKSLFDKTQDYYLEFDKNNRLIR